MMFMNRWDIQFAAERYQRHAVLGKATRFLQAFMEDVDSHSDGWAYWRPPVQSAKRLMMLIESARENPNVTEQAFLKTLAPIRAFYTRRGNAAGMTFPEVR